ncbi:hypothetical protein [Candidatus Palauibacter sp.]|uniref:hypothetical protein n=1 Tax=Candidatus Palauibacter sp. TaxID=3101350 RepID=UPI003B52D1AD
MADMSDQLDPDWRDRVAQVVKAAGSLVPMVGGPLAEVVTVTIPRLRQERIVEYLRQLEARLSTLEHERVNNTLSEPEAIDLVESGGYLAARAVTSERLSRITELVFRGLEADEAGEIRRKRLLGLFGEIDDDEFLLLHDYGQSYGGVRSEAWDALDRPEPAHLGSSREHLDIAQLYEVGRTRLLRLGLLQRNYGHVKRGEYPPFDAQSGGFKSRIEISYLGRMLLRETGIDLPI